MPAEAYLSTHRLPKPIQFTVHHNSRKLESYNIDLANSLNAIIRDLCLSYFALPGSPSEYCLRILETEELITQERLRRQLKDGVNVKLVSSPTKMAAQMVKDLTPEDQSIPKRTIFMLQKYLKEDEFVDEFIARSGLEKLQETIITAQGNTLAYSLTSLQTLMEHDRGWDSFSHQFISTLVSIIVKQNLVNICRPATAIIIKLVVADRSNVSSGIQCYGFDVVNRAISAQASFLPTLVHRLSATDYLLQLNSLHLINSLFRHVSEKFRKSFVEMLDSLDTRRVVLNLMQSNPAEELKAQLVEFQRLLILEGHRRKRTPVNPQNPEHAGMLRDLWEWSGIAPGAPPDWQKLGFTTNLPHRELGRVGVLGLETMFVFAHRDRMNYTRMCIEQQELPAAKRCPFIRTAIEVTEILAEHWEVSTGYSTTTSYQPLLLVFQDVFGFTLHTFFRIWREMDATNTGDEIGRVATLLRCQFKHAASNVKALDPAMLLAFKIEMLETPYPVIRERQLKSLEVQDDFMLKPAIRYLRDRRYKESYEFVKRQRISCLTAGAWFPVFRDKGRVKGLYRFYRLGGNHKFLHYGEFSEMSQRRPLADELTERIDMSLATDLLTGQSSPIFRSKKNQGENPALCFSLVSSQSADQANPSMADFACSSAIQYTEWTDGFNMVLDKNIANRDTAELIQQLTDIDIKLALLDLTGEGVDIGMASILDAPDLPAAANYWYDDGAGSGGLLQALGDSRATTPLASVEDEGFSEAGGSLPL
ncbi:ELMO/CED-12 family-domain-containing protein [Phlyctochytrium arcticum]|nr:ELMO/CED-12 family-domain-containing protein [Phlyctochytrium arcticum]